MAAVGPLRLLAVFAAVRSIVPIASQAGSVIGLARFVMRNSIVSAIVLPLAFLIGSRWGTSGVAAAWLVAYPLVAIPLCLVVLRKMEMSVPAYLRSLWPALSGSLIMVPSVLAVQAALDPAWPALARLLIQVLAGAVAYAGALFFLHRSEVEGLRQVVRTFRGGDTSKLATQA
jgi:teichuronic acid exporter